MQRALHTLMKRRLEKDESNMMAICIELLGQNIRNFRPMIRSSVPCPQIGKRDALRTYQLSSLGWTWFQFLEK